MRKTLNEKTFGTLAERMNSVDTDFFANVLEKIYDDGNLAEGLDEIADEADDIEEIASMYIEALCAREAAEPVYVAHYFAQEYILGGQINKIAIHTYKDSLERVCEALDVIERFEHGFDVSCETVLEAINVVYKHGTGHFGENALVFAFEDEADASLDSFGVLADDDVYAHVFDVPLSANALAGLISFGNTALETFERSGFFGGVSAGNILEFRNRCDRQICL